MDVDEENVSDTATECKRQKRNNSKDDVGNIDDGGDEADTTTTTVGSTNTETEASVVPDAGDADIVEKLVGKITENVESCTTTNNNNNNNNNSSSKEDIVGHKEEQKAESIKPSLVDAIINIDNAEDNTSSQPATSSPAATQSTASTEEAAVSNAGEPNQPAAESSPPSSGDDNDEDTDDLMRINQSISRFYSGWDENEHESASPASLGDSDHLSPSPLFLDDIEHESRLPVFLDDNEQESRSPPFLDESSSDSSVAFWNRYYTSSNEDADSDDDLNESMANPADKEQIEIAVNKVMCKSKPSYGWNLDQELMQRENQLFNRVGWRGGQTSAQSFSRGYYGSRQVVERMSLLDVMGSHKGCVNSLNFNRSGDLICSGSDDLSIIVWNWANGKPRHSFKSGHSYNIFQTKFIDSAGCLDIVSSSRDGQVRRAVIPPSGSSSIKPIRLYSHNEAVHKLVVVPQSRHEIMSAGEDASIKHYDLRSNTSTTLLRCVDDNRRVRLFSISHHPYTTEFCISGSDDKLRVYDKRRLPKSVHVMTPKDLKDTKITQITCAVYNHSGSEILASYSDAGIYLYDSRNYQDGKYLHSYEGHINSRTIKGVNFFGPESEYIVSGSDCGNVFFWDKNTEAVINFRKGDDAGVVNCLEPHPSMPVLATSGLEHNVKIWTPHGSRDPEWPNTDALKETLQRNFRRSLLDVGDFNINQIHYFVRQLINPLANGAANRSTRGQINRDNELFASSSSSNSSSSTSSGNTSRIEINGLRQGAAQDLLNRDSNASSSDEGNPDPLGCRPQ